MRALCTCWFFNYKSSRPEMIYKREVLRTLAIFRGITCVKVSFSLQLYLKRDSDKGVFIKCLRTHFLSSWRLPVDVESKLKQIISELQLLFVKDYQKFYFQVRHLIVFNLSRGFSQENFIIHAARSKILEEECQIKRVHQVLKLNIQGDTEFLNKWRIFINLRK